MVPEARSPSLRSSSARMVREELVRYTMRLRVGLGSSVVTGAAESREEMGDAGIESAHWAEIDSGGIGGTVSLWAAGAGEKGTTGA